MPTVHPSAKSFMTILQTAEKTGDVSALCSLFADDCRVGSIATRQPHEGSAGATKFWKTYLEAFKTVASSFIHVHTSGVLAVLEWTSEGILPSGTPINYQGVTILEFNGKKIARLRTYYDSAAFLPDGAKLLGRETEI